MKHSSFIILIFFSIALLLTHVFFSKLHDGQFLFIGDQFFRFNYFEAFINSFFIRKIENLNVLNGWQFITQFWDVLYYLFIYSFHIPSILAEKLNFFLVLFLSLSFSFVGFRNLSKLVHGSVSSITIFVITLWYCFNPYTVVLWHGGVYNLGSSLTYSLAPLILYYFHISLFSKFSLQNTLICAILMAIASYTFWLFAPLAFLLILYSFFYLLFTPKVIISSLKNVFFLILVYLPMISFILFNIMYEYYGNSGDNNALFTPTFGNQQGGLWYQILLLFSWGIYTTWTPRSMYSFYNYYFSHAYINATIAMYILIIFGTVKYFVFLLLKYITKKKFLKPLPNFALLYVKKNIQTLHFDLGSKLLIVFSLLLVISLFFAKAAQPPYGDIFLYFYHNVPFFSVFRTADVRFGFCVVLSISSLFLLISRGFYKYIILIALLLIMYYQIPFFFTGKAIRGENIKNLYYDRTVYYPKEYTDLISYLNNDRSIATYLLPLPAVEYGNYAFDKGEHHFGQDLLSKMVYKPFVYLSLSSGMYTRSYQELKDVVEKKRFEKLKYFPIKYLLLRHDIACTGCVNFSENELVDKYKLSFKNKTFTLFELKNYSAIINSSNAQFTVINPIKFRIRFQNISKTQTLYFLTSFNKDWKLYITKPNSASFCKGKKECVKDLRYFEGEEISYLWKKPLFGESHRLAYNYANSWQINPKTIKMKYNDTYYTMNEDGSINFDMVLYYRPQSWFYVFFLFSVTSMAISSFLVLRNIRKYKKKKKHKNER